MRKNSIYMSLGFHVAVIIATMISLPWLKRDFDIPQPISVEFAPMDKITQTDKVAPKPAPKEEKKEEPKTPPPAKAASNDSAEPVKKTETKAEKKEEPKKEPEKEALPDKKKEKKKEKKEEKKKDPEKAKSFDSLLKNLAEPKPAADAKEDMKVDEKASAEGNDAPLGPKLTMSEEDALRRQLAQCWSVPFGAKDAEKIAVEIYMVIRADRTLQSAKVVDQGRYASDSFFRAMADSAIRAVRNPLCSPFQVPPDKYDTWKETTVVFDPSKMF